MTPPAVAAQQLLIGCLLGCAGGLWLGFLRPLRPRWLFDLFFLWGLFRLWLYLGFAVCDGNLRLSHTIALVGCVFLWEQTAGRLLHPLFSGFWRIVRRIFRFCLFPLVQILKKICIFAKKIFAKGKKWGTIKWKNYLPQKRRKGGVSRGPRS